MKREIIHGAVNQTDDVFIQDSSATTGVGLPGLVYNSASLTAYYARPLEAAVAISLVTQTVTGAHTDGGFVEIDATNMPGWYRIDWPDAMFVKGKASVGALLKGATDMAPLPVEFMLDDRQGYNVLLDTTINVVTDNSHFTINNPINDNSALFNSSARFFQASSLDPSFRDVTSYVGATGAVILESDTDYDLTSGDRVIFYQTARGFDPASDTVPELAQGQPPAAPTYDELWMLLYMALRNQLDVEASGDKKVHNDAGTVITKKALSDDGNTYSEAKMVTGP